MVKIATSFFLVNTAFNEGFDVQDIYIATVSTVEIFALLLLVVFVDTTKHWTEMIVYPYVLKILIFTLYNLRCNFIFRDGLNVFRI